MGSFIFPRPALWASGLARQPPYPYDLGHRPPSVALNP